MTRSALRRALPDEVLRRMAAVLRAAIALLTT
jgi:hypothetical protein